MADPRQHVRPLPDLTVDTLPHAIEGGGCDAHFSGALDAKILAHLAALTEGVGGLRQSPDGAYLVAHEDGGNGEKHQGGADHPENKNIGGRAEQPFAWHDDRKHAGWHLNVNDHACLEGRRVQHERSLNAFLECMRHG